MELIVNGENVLEPVNLEKNKNEIEKQRESVPAEITFTPFREKNLFFRANVKGGDLNELVTALQKTFSDVNSRESNIYDQLDTVFKTVESIHKGSIEGIIVAVKSAQGAISQAEYAIDRIKDTLDILQNFKDQLEDNTEHLRDIDDIWEDTLSIPMQKCILFGNSEHPFPEKQSIPFRSRVQLMISTQMESLFHVM